MPVALGLALLTSIFIGSRTDPAALPEVVFTDGLEGGFASTSCGRSDTPPRLLRISAELETWPGAVRLDAGDVLGASSVAQLTVEHDLSGMVRALRELGLQGLALGGRDLATARPTLVKAARALRAAGLPFLASNLSCGPRGRDVCAAIRGADAPPWLVETPEGSLGVVAVLAPGTLNRVAPDRREGLRLEEPRAAVLDATRKARAAGARFVIALYDGEPGSAVSDLLALGAQLAEVPDGPDALIAAHLAGRFERAISARLHPLPVVATDPGHARLVLPRSEPAPEPLREPGPLGLVRWSWVLSEWLCRADAPEGTRWPLRTPLTL
jgi:hypothetical protein